MDDADTARLFARYARHGDPRALAEVFDRTAPDLLRLGLHLVRCEADAEDLLQSTFLTAIRRAGEFDEQRPVLPWLCGILVRLARRHAAAARSVRAADAERSERDPLEDATASEVSSTLRATIERLDEPHREPMRLRVVEGLSTVAIAARLDRSPGTVRVQIHRGFEQLRRILPRGIALSAALELTHGRGLALVRKSLLEHAAAASSAPNAVALGGALLMKKLSVLVACGTLVAALWGLKELGSTPLVRPGAAAPDAGELARADAPPEPSSRPRSEREVAPTPAPPIAVAAHEAEPSMRVLVRFGDGAPAAGVLVRADPSDGRDPRFHHHEARTDAEGSAVLERLVPGLARVELDRGARATVELRAGERSELAMTIPAGLDVEGIVVGDDGEPVPGARVWHGQLTSASSLDPCTGVLEHAAVADERGRFRLRSLPLPATLSARAPQRGPSRVLEVAGLAKGSTLEVTLTLEGPGHDVAGVVVDAGGAPVAGALVSIGDVRVLNSIPLPDGHRVRKWERYFLRTDASGRFLAEGVPPGAATVRVESELHAPFEEAIDVAGSIGELRCVLEGGGRVFGTVTGPDGAPIPGATIVGSQALLYVAGERLRADALGRYSLGNLPVGPASLHVKAPGFEIESAELVLAAGTPLRFDPVLRPQPTIRGRVLDAARRPLPGVRVHGEKSSRGFGTYGGGCETDAEGAFELAVPAGERYTLVVREGGALLEHRCKGLGLVAPGTRGIEVVLADGERASASLAGVLVGRDGEPLLGAALQRVDGDGSRWVGHSDPSDGSFAVGKLPPGTHRLHVVPRRIDEQPFTVGPVELAAWEARDLGRVGPGPGGMLAFSYRVTDGSPADGITATLSPAGEGARVSLCCLSGRETHHALPAGDYTLEVWGHGFVTVRDRPVAIRPGEWTRVELALERAVRRHLVMRPPLEGEVPAGDARAAAKVALERVAGGEGPFRCADELSLRANGELHYVPSLTLGSYRITVAIADRAFAGAFDVVDLEPSTEPLEVVLVETPR